MTLDWWANYLIRRHGARVERLPIDCSLRVWRGLRERWGRRRTPSYVYFAARLNSLAEIAH